VLPVVVSQSGWDVGAVSLAAAIASLMIGVMQPFVGRWVDRYGARLVLSAGIGLVGLGALATAGASQLWQLYLAFGILAGIGFGATLQLTGGVLAARWFTRRRGFAVSLVHSGVAVASFVIIPAAMWLVLRLGWDGYYLVSGVVILLAVVPATFLLVRNTPGELGLSPDGMPGEIARAALKAEAGAPLVPVSIAARTATFWQLGFGMFV
jgi:MFS family permease